MIGRRFLIALLATLITVSALAREGEEEEIRLLGPLHTRDMTPFGLLVLDMFPSYTPEMEKGWTVEVGLQAANNWLPSESALEYLEGRSDPRAPLDEADAQALLALGEDVFFVDSGIQLLTASFYYAFNQRWAAYVTLPALFFNGGSLDGSIEGFHKKFAFSSQGRDLMARDRFAAVVNIQGQQVSAIAAPTDGGIADPVLGARRSFVRGNWGLVVEGAVKLSFAEEEKSLSTGSEDFGLQLMAQRRFRRHGFYFGASHVWVGGYRSLERVAAESIFGAIVAWEWAATARGSFHAQLYARQSAIQESSDPDITAEKFQVSLGWRWRQPRTVYSIALTENMETMNNTPDIGLHLSVAWLSGRRSAAAQAADGGH